MKTRKDYEGQMNLPPSTMTCTKCGQEIKGYLNRHKCKPQPTPTPWELTATFSTNVIHKASDNNRCDDSCLKDCPDHRDSPHTTKWSHTPTPWELDFNDKEIFAKGHGGYCIAMSNTEKENWKENAAFIVRATTYHDELVAIAKSIATGLATAEVTLKAKRILKELGE